MSTEFIGSLYDGFNRRDIDAVLSLLSDDVAWANGMDGGHVHGRDAVRAYWTAQWSTIDPHVDPIDIASTHDGTFAVTIHQVVHDLEGNPLLDEMVRHVFHVEAGRVRRFDIDGASQLSAVVHESSR